MRNLVLSLSLPIMTLALAGVALTQSDVAGAAEGGAVVPETPAMARGTVYHDKNGNEVRDAHEPGIAGVKVSNGREVVATGADGRWELPASEDTIFFVIKPRGWMTPVDEDNVPRYFYIHKPKGSPKMAYAGSKPTGPLPESIDFPLHPQRESLQFEVLLFGDSQPESIRDVNYYARDIIPELIGTKASFGMTLGDIVGDDLSLFEPITDVTGKIGIPWYYVYGNHDMNLDAISDDAADDSYELRFGPTNFAFQRGNAHFIGLDNIEFIPRPGRRGAYRAKFDGDALTFVRNYLKFVPSEHLVVVAFHIHLDDRNTNLSDFLQLFEKHPHNVSISAHTHVHRTLFFGRDQGYPGPSEHVHLNMVTTCGSWWLGQLDPSGLPHARMRDGGPNGYGILRVDGNRFALRYKAARRPISYQMDIYCSDELPQSETEGHEVIANIFNGSKKSEVWMRVGDSGMWAKMQQVTREDPQFLRMMQREKLFREQRIATFGKIIEDASNEGQKGASGERLPSPLNQAAKKLLLDKIEKTRVNLPWRRLPKAVKSSHLWTGKLPALKPGTYLVHVKTRDMFGETWTGRRVLRVLPGELVNHQPSKNSGAIKD
ncbi:MAG: metallophosphoesterase [Planctomycetota bacterium]|nr:MAG: metallophosphoesterase [Planctomycetota bacterium]